MFVCTQRTLRKFYHTNCETNVGVRDKLMQIPAVLLKPDNGVFDTGGYTDTRGGNIEGQYIVKAIIVPFLNI